MYRRSIWRPRLSCLSNAPSPWILDFSRTPHNQPTLEAICQRLDCLPLALELCAAEIDLLSPPQLLAHLQDRRLDLLVEGAHDLPPRQRTLRIAIGHSYALLNDEERLLFRSLGVFAGGFDLPAVAAVAADRTETSTRPLHSSLHALIGKSLVHVEKTPRRRAALSAAGDDPRICPGASAGARRRGAAAPASLRHLSASLPHRRSPLAGTRGCPGLRAWNPNRTTSVPPCSGRSPKHSIQMALAVGCQLLSGVSVAMAMRRHMAGTTVTPPPGACP